jgi:hypothetical protein
MIIKQPPRVLPGQFTRDNITNGDLLFLLDECIGKELQAKALGHAVKRWMREKDEAALVLVLGALNAGSNEIDRAKK